MAITLILPMLVLGTVWMPQIRHYYVGTPALSNKVVTASRERPSDALLKDLNVNSGILGLDYRGSQAVKLADLALSGRLALPGFPTISITPSFSPDDLDKGTPTLRLHIASLAVPEILLIAYRLTDDAHYFITARDYLLAFSRFERNAWLPAGYLWNDHAIAARVFLLSRFWRIYRSHRSYNAQDARILLQAVARSAELLSKPSHFTFATNHGVMQNLALLHVCVAFPELLLTEQYQKVAITRLEDQLKFYISPEGVVLEHSAAYHEMGIMLLTEAFRHMSMLGLPVPLEWREKYANAVDFLAQIKRPDGTLPRFGNTDGEGRETLRVASFTPQGYVSSLTNQDKWGKPRPHYMAEASGYATWWDGLDEWPKLKGLRQTVMVWSYYPGHGHKHADEMSVLLWARGQDWWTNIGYWPYGDELYHQAQSWQGSNAPHLINEPEDSNRSTKVLNQAWSDDIAFSELQRTGPQDYRARRQVVHILDHIWMVIDEVSDPAPAARNSRVIWTANPDVAVNQMELPNVYRLRGQKSGTLLNVAILGSEGITISRAKGSIEPFAGWVAGFNEIHKAPAFVIEMSANSWTASVWRLLPESAPQKIARSPKMIDWQNSGHWQMALPLPQGTVTVRRDQDKLAVDGIASGRKVLALQRGTDVGQQTRTLRKHFESAAQKYETFKDLQYYRERVTYVLVFLLVLQEGFFSVHRRVWRKSGVSRPTLRGLVLVMWGGLGVWLPLVYFSA